MDELGKPVAIGRAWQDDVGEDGADIKALLQDHDGSHTGRCLKDLEPSFSKAINSLLADGILIFDHEDYGLKRLHEVGRRT